MEFKKGWIRTKNVVLVLLIACVGLGSSIAVAQSGATNSGFELDYFHAYRQARTYSIQLQNGLAATFDFRHGTATLYYGRQQSTMPLDQVFLQAANGNSNLATRMYNQMYQNITAAHSDTIMKSVPNANTHSLHPLLSTPPGGTIGIGDSDSAEWAIPVPGDCWPVPIPCQQWPDGAWGTTYWFNTPFGSDPFTNVPPNPDNCAPGDIDCKIWENNRQQACDRDFSNGLEITALTVRAAAACTSAIESLGLSSYMCAGALAAVGRAAYNNARDDATCHIPFPGHP